jgi:cytochrome c
MSKFPKLLAATAIATLAAAPVLAEKLGLGRAALPEELAAWDVNVLPDGRGLPEGSMSVLDGESVFVENCASCHGDFAEGLDNWPALAGGRGTLRAQRPVKTVGSYWPHLSTVWDYVHRSMPFGGAQTLEPDEVYGIVAYILYSEGLVDDDFVLSNENFLDVRLPNEDGFYVDDRVEAEFPIFTAEPCMSGCKDAVEITRKASDLKVTPTDADGRPAGTIPDTTGAEIVTASAEAAAPVEEAPSGGADPALVAEGESLFRQCKACHEVGEGARNKTGPHLNGVIGRQKGGLEGFRYSKAMLEAGEAGGVWTEETLAAFLADPRGYLKGTKMSFRGLKSDEEIAAMNAYLATLTE